MKKKILTALLILIVLVIAAPFAAAYWYGWETESAFEHLAADIARRTGARLSVNAYERGWLSSTAETDMALQGAPVTVTLTHTLHHGPIALERWLRGEPDLELFQARVHSEVTSLHSGSGAEKAMLRFAKPPLVAQTTARADGTLESQLQLASSRELAPRQPSLEWAAGSGTIVASPDLKRYELDATLPSLRLAGETSMAGPLEVRNLRLRSQMSEDAQGYAFGTTNVDVARVAFGDRAAASGFAIKATTRPAGPNLELITEYRLGELQVGAQKAGPAQLTVEVRKLDLASLVRFSEEVREIYQRDLPEQQARLMVVGKLLALVTALAEKSPELEVTRLSLKTANGEITGQARLVLDGSRSDVRTNPMRLLTALRGDAQVTLPAPILRPLVAPLIEQDLAAYRARGALTDREAAALRGETLTRVIDRAMPLYLARHDLGRWLQPAGDQYRVQAALRQGQFLINGRLWTAQTAQLP